MDPQSRLEEAQKQIDVVREERGDDVLDARLSDASAIIDDVQAAMEGEE